MKMASAKKISGRTEKCLNGKRSPRHQEGPVVMDTQEAFSALHSVCEENMDFFSGEGGGAKGGAGEAGRRLVRALALIQEHARCLEPIVHGFSTIYHHFDYDALVPANGYRSLVKVVRSCVLHIVHKGRYISSSRRSVFYRAAHNAGEMEAYCSALCQLRALLYLAQRLLHDNAHGDLFLQEHSSLSLLRQYASMYKGCFYGRCLGFQFTPAIRPCLQTIAIGLVAFGENYKRHQSGIVETGGITPYGVVASSLFTSGKYAIDPELRGAEFERITQNLDVHFWKSFWNVTETEVLSSLANMTSTQVKVNRTLSLPPMPFDLPLAADPKATVTIAPPSAHIGSAPVQMRLISHELREGQDSEALLSLCRPEGGARSLTLGLKAKPSPPSPCLMVHFHGGGFVAQTSKSHEPYLKSWSQDLGVPILSVDYSLAPEAPFPRALEECFYAYCWALKHCHLLGWTGECVCLAGDSAGGNLCVTTAMRAVALGVRVPDGIMAAYPATLLSACASPSRLLTLVDPLLPLSVLSRCLAAYAGGDPPVDPQAERQVQRAGSGLSLLLRDFRVGASNWVHSLLDPSRATVPPSATEDTPPPATDTVRSSVSEVFLCSLHSDPPLSDSKESLKSRTCQDLAMHQNSVSNNAPLLPEHTPDDVHFYLSEESSSSLSQAPLSVASPPPGGQEAAGQGSEGPPSEFPLGFQPLRSEQPAVMHLQTSAVVRDPFCSPLLAPDSLLRGLPPVHIVACSLDPMLDDSVMLAKRLRGAQQPVTLCVVDDLPHGFLSLSQLSRETRAAADVCVERVRLVFDRRGTAPPEPRKHRGLERTGGARPITPGDRTVGEEEGPVATAAQGNGAVGGVGA